MGLLSDSDIGKKLFDHEGNVLGKITDVGDDSASVHPDSSADPARLSPYDLEMGAPGTIRYDEISRVEEDGVYVRKL